MVEEEEATVGGVETLFVYRKPPNMTPNISFI